MRPRSGRRRLRTRVKSSARVFMIFFVLFFFYFLQSFGRLAEPELIRHSPETYIGFTVRDKTSGVHVVRGNEVESLEEDAVVGVDELDIATDNRNHGFYVVKSGVVRKGVQGRSGCGRGVGGGGMSGGRVSGRVVGGGGGMGLVVVGEGSDSTNEGKGCNSERLHGA